MLFRALLSANDAQVAALARQAVSRFAGMEPGRPVGGTYYLYRTLRNLDLDRCPRAADGDGARRRPRRAAHPARRAPGPRRVQEPPRPPAPRARGRDPAPARGRPGHRGPGPVPAQAPARGDRLHARHPRRAGLAAPGHPPPDPQAGRAPGPQAPPRPQGTSRLPVHHAPLAVHRRASPSTPSSATRARPSPRSSSSPTSRDRWPSFARFTLHLVHAISSQFSKVRSFVFIDGIDEVTRFFENVDDVADAVHRINTEADVVWVDGHSDYGHALSVFWERWGEEITPRAERAAARRRPQQLPRRRRPGSSRRSATAPATCTGSIPSPAPTGARATPSWGSTPCTATTCSSAGTCASSSTS